MPELNTKSCKILLKRAGLLALFFCLFPILCFASLTGPISINNSAAYTKSTSVTLTLSAADNGSGMGKGAQMQFSNNNTVWSAPQAYATTKAWKLISGNGRKTVYVRFRKAGGLWPASASAQIILDITPPSIHITPVVSPTNQNVTLSYTVSDNFSAPNEIVVTGDKSPYIKEGSYNVSLTAKDQAGNISKPASVKFVIDKTSPKIIIISPLNGLIVDTPKIQLKGTIDKKVFSESRILTEGENTLTKTTTDSAGNTASASVTVTLYTGQLIGSSGGEVTSPDEKVKVIIPVGALNKPTRVEIINLNKETLKSAAPSGTSLLSVVECSPSGIVFKKPVQISYTFSQAVVPGTPVTLGLYDSVKKKITSTGQVSVVPVDGYTVIFSITHFSGYAALGALTPQSTPIGGGVKIPLPDLLTGAFGHAIPITVPPGRKGIQPSLALSYHSSSANSWVGLGFSLNPGYIVRSTRLGPPSYNDIQDTFYLITDSGTTELVNLIDNLYQAKVESSFTKFFKETDDSWRVVGKDGSILRFGQSSDARETSSQGTFSWYLTKATDTNGNYIQYNYLRDQGKAYLSRIDYTGNENGTSPSNSVEFTLESRNDIYSSYISTSKVATAKRLKEIEAKVNGDLAWSYELGYDYSPDTNRSILKSIKQKGSDDKSLPVQTLSYQRTKDEG